MISYISELKKMTPDDDDPTISWLWPFLLVFFFGFFWVFFSVLVMSIKFVNGTWWSFPLFKSSFFQNLGPWQCVSTYQHWHCRSLFRDFWYGIIGDSILFRIWKKCELYTDSNLFCELLKKIGSIVPRARMIQLPPHALSILTLAI